jgi:hypothetical protein
VSYLTLPNFPSFDKAVISFWVRVPQESLDAAKADVPPDSGPVPMLTGLVPFMVMGKEGIGLGKIDQSNQQQEYHNSGSVFDCSQGISYTFVCDSDLNGCCKTAHTDAVYYTVCQPPWTYDTVSFGSTISYSAEPGPPTNPSFIAVDGNGRLSVNFESAKLASVVMQSDLTNYVPAYKTGAVQYNCNTLNLPCVNGGGRISMTCYVCFCLNDPGSEDALVAAAESGLGDNVAGVGPDEPTETYGELPNDKGTGSIQNGDFDIPALTADHWHHVLISVDMSGGSTSHGLAAGEPAFSGGAANYSSTSLLYIAIDDVNYLANPNSWFAGTNKAATGDSEAIANTSQATNTLTHAPEGAIPSYSISDMSVPFGDLGIPATAKYVNKIRHAEMAEFQMWTGKALDTGDVKNRRAFIDAQGKPVPPNKKPTDTDPTSGAIALLGKPNVTLHGSGNWVKGHNTGTTGVDADGKDIPSGQFKATGKIKKYKPEPSLHGPQSPATRL